MQKESKAQRTERIKREKHPIDIFENIHFYAKSGEVIDDEMTDRLKWYGIYPHSKSSNNQEKRFHMLRVKVVGGKLNLGQLKVLCEISKRFAKDTANISVRHDLQFHYIEIKDAPAIFKMLSQVGLTTQMACGDCPRNIVTCPLCGIIDDELVDVSQSVNILNQYFQGNRVFANLPRKFKMGVCACKKRCMIEEIQDLSFVAIENKNEILFNVYVGGGLGSNREFAKLLGAIKEEQILTVAKAVTEIYRVYGNRENRAKARIGHLLKDWGVDKFRETLEKDLGFLLTKTKELAPITYLQREHYGETKSTNRDNVHIGFTTEAGDVGSKGLEDIYNALKNSDVENIAFTTTQNFIALDVCKKNSKTLQDELQEVGFFSTPSAFRVRTLACTGLKYCKFAICETKDLQKRVVAYLDEKFPNFNEQISLSFNGCTNSCAHPHLSTLGFIGSKVKVDGELVGGFSLIVGAKLDEKEKSFSIKTGVKVADTKTHLLIEEILNSYLDSGYGDGFGKWLAQEYGK